MSYYREKKATIQVFRATISKNSLLFIHNYRVSLLLCRYEMFRYNLDTTLSVEFVDEISSFIVMLITVFNLFDANLSIP